MYQDHYLVINYWCPPRSVWPGVDGWENKTTVVFEQERTQRVGRSFSFKPTHSHVKHNVKPTHDNYDQVSTYLQRFHNVSRKTVPIVQNNKCWNAKKNIRKHLMADWASRKLGLRLQKPLGIQEKYKPFAVQEHPQDIQGAQLEWYLMWLLVVSLAESEMSIIEEGSRLSPCTTTDALGWTGLSPDSHSRIFIWNAPLITVMAILLVLHVVLWAEHSEELLSSHGHYSVLIMLIWSQEPLHVDGAFGLRGLTPPRT